MTRSAEGGRVSVMLAIAVTGLLFIIGVAHDAGGQIRTTMYAEQVAAEAARAGGQAVDPAVVAGSGRQRVDEAAARRAALAYLDDAGVDGQVEIDGGGTEITVQVTVAYHRQILGLFGFGDYRVTRSATARLVAG